MPPIWAMLLAALDAVALAALLALDPAALVAAAEVAALVVAAAEVVELAALPEVPVQLDNSGTATALAMPAPINRSSVRRFTPVLLTSASKSESDTVDLRFHRGRPSAAECQQNVALECGEVNTF